jgi:hypothetical protein
MTEIELQVIAGILYILAVITICFITNPEDPKDYEKYRK